jgi:hypothetical protein
MKGGDITMANIFVLNNIAKRCMLWELMVKYLPIDCGWILVGDFNMVEHQVNKISVWEMRNQRSQRKVFVRSSENFIKCDGAPKILK